jgi:hypothetical protein
MALGLLGALGVAGQVLPQAFDIGSLLVNTFSGRREAQDAAEFEANIARQDAEQQAFLAREEARGVQKAAELNKLLAERDAESITKYGLNRAREIGEQVSQIIGSQKAMFARAGVSIDSGSPLEVVAETVYEGEKSRAQEIYNSLAHAKRIRTEAAMQQFQASEAMRTAELAGQSYLRTAMNKGQTSKNIAATRSRSLLLQGLMGTSQAVKPLASTIDNLALQAQTPENLR